MKASIESTQEVAQLKINGVAVPARVWQGRTENGVEFIAFITRIAVPEHSGLGPGDRFKQDHSQFERELTETPNTELRAGGYQLVGPIDLRLLI